ncbi:MAG: hypothetical protein RL417_297 [Pseudomonadota bacterium]|jgi:hypothetical protein
MELSRPDKNYRALERLAAATRETSDLKGVATDAAIQAALLEADLTGKAGRRPAISIGEAHELTLPSHVRESVKELLSPHGYRPEGVLTLPTDRPLQEREFQELKDYFALSYEHPGVVDLERVERIFPNQRFYHATNALSFALHREIGWLSPEDIACVAQDICGLKDYLEIDPGFFVGNDLSWVAGYALPWADDRPSDLLKVLKIDTKDPTVRRLMNTGLLLEIDLADFRKQLPDTGSFVVRQGDINRERTVFEVIAPIAPMKIEVRATIDFNGR